MENYRGITLLSTFGKLFTRILNNRLNEWAETYHVYIEAQSGFRRQLGTIDNVFVLHGLIKHFINEGKRLYAAFIDFTKAFDYVVRENLWLKLIKVGVRGKILNIIKSMYTSVKSMVKYDNCLSQEFSCYLGVRQGECLSPFLFSIYLNAIEAEFVHSNCKGVEDEFHFILECTLFEDLRKRYIKRYFWVRPNIPKFVELMTSEHKHIIRNLGNYTFECLKIRNNLN